METSPKPELVRALGRWTLTALVMNSIIGSGIFGLPSVVAGYLGPYSTYACFLAAIGIGIIMACFAEVASQFNAAGGPYLYVRESFGRFLGIQMGWMAWLVRITAAAAAANLFVDYLGEFWPNAVLPLQRIVLITLMVGFLAWVNIRGVSAGAQLSNIFTVAKLLPLVIFVVVGLFWLKPGAELSTPAGSGDWLKATLVLIFAYGGFEAALMPMGEAKNPRRDAPFALFTALVACTLLYTLILAVVLNLLPNPASASRPLAAAAREFMGPAGAILITLGALISVYGYLSSQMLNSPRLTYALAEKRDFPDFFKAIHEKYRTPHASIIIFALLLWGLAVVGSFKWNVFLSAVARLFTYGLVCAALIVLRRKRPDCLAFRLPGGYLFSVLGVLFSLVLVSQMGLTETLIISATVAIAGMNWLWVRRAWPAGDNS